MKLKESRMKKSNVHTKFTVSLYCMAVDHHPSTNIKRMMVEGKRNSYLNVLVDNDLIGRSN